jgi:hypothetical protein
MKHTTPKSVQANAKRGVDMASGPDISSNDLPEPSMQSGRKLASGKPISDEHVRAMADYHSAHMGDCPSDNDAEGCDDLLWGGPAGGGWAASRVAAMDATSLSEDTGPLVTTLLAADDPFSIELYTRPDLLLEGKTDLAKGEDGLIWAPILRSGTLACRPDPTAPNGRKNEPLVFVGGHAGGPSEIGLQDIVDAFNDNAVQHVTIPKTHKNDEFENTGFIKQMKIVDSTVRPGEKVVLAGHEFLDADAEARVERGLIANRSCGILHGYQNTETGKTYPHVVEHVALTNKPWVTGMAPYGSNQFTDGREVVSLMLSDDRSVAPPFEDPDPTAPPKIVFSTQTPLEQFQRETQLADIVWDDQDDSQPSLSKIQSGLYSALSTMGNSPYYDEPDIYFDVRDIKPSSALVTMSYSGSDPMDAWVVPFTFEDGQLKLSDFSQWKVVTQAWVADDDANQDKDEVQQLLQQDTSLSLADAQAIVATYLAVPAFIRNKAKANGDTLPDGSYPITTQAQAQKAWDLRNNGKAAAATVIAHIKAQVKKHKLEMPKDKAPAKTNAALPTDPLKRASMLRLSQGRPPATTGGIMPLDTALLDSLDLSDTQREALQKAAAPDAIALAQLAEYRKREKEEGRATRLARVREIFGESATGTIAEFDALLMADDGDAAVTLNLADGLGGQKPVHLTVTQIVDRIIASIPKKAEAGAATTALAAAGSLLTTPLSGRPDLEVEPAGGGETKQMTGDELLARWKKNLPEGVDLAIANQPATTTQA